MGRRLLLPLVVVVACLLAACVPVTTAAPPPPPPPPPQPVSQYCAPATPTNATGYQSAFNTLRRTYTEWATADGAVPVLLSASKTLWMFGDTLVGKVKSSGAIPTNAPIVSNSAVLQTGSCFTPMLGGAPLHRSAWIADPAAQQGYWPASAVTDPGANRLYVFLLHFVRTPTTQGFDTTVVGTRIARFKLSTLQLLGISSADLAGTSTTTPYGSTAFEHEGFAYMYSSNDGHIKVARAPLASVESQSTWSYWMNGGVDPESDDDDKWSAPGNHSQAADMPFSITVEENLTTLDFGAPIAPLRVEPYGVGFLGTAMLVDGFVPRAVAFIAPTPQGPWTYVAPDIATTPNGLRSYGAQTPFGLQGAPPPMLIHSINVEPGVPLSIDNYGFRFISVTLPPPFVATTATEVPEPPPSTEPSTTTSSSTTSSTTSTSTTSSSTTSTSAPPP